MKRVMFHLMAATLLSLTVVGTAFPESQTITQGTISKDILPRFDRPHAIPDQNLLITSIQNNAVIPNNHRHPLIEWAKPDREVAAFLIEITSGRHDLKILLKENHWQPEGNEFERFLQEKEVWITLYRLDQERTYKSQPLRLLISETSLKERIAYRVVQPLFNPALPNAIKVFSFNQKEPVTLLELEGTCVGCHRYSPRSAFFNVKKGKDRRLVTATRDNQQFQLDHQAAGEFSFFTISRDGKYAAFVMGIQGTLSTNPTVSEPFDLPYRSGDIYSYDVEKKSLTPLKGASDPNFVEDMPAFSPDGKSLIFTRYPSGIKEGATSIPFMDLYQIPFNGGRGGEPVPVPNASSNQKHHYFARYSPNGKWISFCIGDGRRGIFARKTSDIYLLSVDGNSLTKLNLNMDQVMDSWHDWSSDSRWLIFSSNRGENGMTALYLSHIDSQGRDYPPVKLVGYDRWKVNTPQFIPEGLDLKTVKDFKGYIEGIFQAPKR